MQIKSFIDTQHREYIEDIENWCNEQYQLHFKDCFDSVRKIHHSMESQVRPISDTELEWILTELPMKLFSISESLNKYKLEHEVVKLRKKTIKLELDDEAKKLAQEDILSKSDMKSWVDAQLSEHDILLAAYSSVISRIESEISFSKELIMGCKKIWDSRRKSETSNPVNPIDSQNIDNLPDYRSTGYYKQSYIK